MEKRYTPEEERAYYAALPRKACSAAVLLRDAEGRAMLVKPIYKSGWQIPGGVVDANEPPRRAAAREIREELGLTRLEIGRILAIQHSPWTGDKGDALHWIFDGGVVTEQDLGTIVLQENEISEWKFVDANELGTYLKSKAQKRLEAAFHALASNETAYLEETEES